MSKHKGCRGKYKNKILGNSTETNCGDGNLGLYKQSETYTARGGGENTKKCTYAPGAGMMVILPDTDFKTASVFGVSGAIGGVQPCSFQVSRTA